MRELAIDGFRVRDDGDCFVIAEIGHNHQGDVEKAKQLIRRAKECGADAVKLQKRDNRTLYTAAMYDKPYEHENSFGPTYGAHREFLEFGWEEYDELKRYSSELGIIFFATAFDFKSADFLHRLGVPAYKIASGDLKNIPLIRHVASFGKPVIVSTGGGAMKDVERAAEAVLSINARLCLMQCTAAYPTSPEDVHLDVIRSFRRRFPHTIIGFSDHYNGIAMAVAAYVLGACVIEKHFTLDHTWKGTDHAFSLEPIGLQKMVRDLRRVKIAIGSPVKRSLDVEKAPLVKMGKKLVAARDLTAGHVLEREDIAIKSPGDGLPPYEIDKLIGRKLTCDVAADKELDFPMLAEKLDGKLLSSNNA